MALAVAGLARSDRYDKDLAGAPPDIQQAAKEALKLLLRNPSARSLRLHTLDGYPKPTIWKIDVQSNHSWQITFEMRANSVAFLLRLGTHKIIDRAPR